MLSQMNEGRASLAQVEQARSNEDEKWILFYDAQYTAEKAAWDLLRQTGNLLRRSSKRQQFPAPAG